jgi:hypothetical protein
MKNNSAIVHRQSEKGQSLVEFAFSLVMLLILVAGIVDLGRALFTYLSIRDAAQEGALYASLNPTDTTCIIQRTRDSSTLISGLGNEIIVTVAPTVGTQLCAGSTGGVRHGIRVTINYPNFPLAMPFMSVIVGGSTVPISASVIDSIIIPKCK